MKQPHSTTKSYENVDMKKVLNHNYKKFQLQQALKTGHETSFDIIHPIAELSKQTLQKTTLN